MKEKKQNEKLHEVIENDEELMPLSFSRIFSSFFESIIDCGVTVRERERERMIEMESHFTRPGPYLTKECF
jgi:hypothetical protein